jgi:hypothetical protein
MPAASELTQVAPSLFLWQAYDPVVKADLFSSAVATADGIYLVDPISLDPDPLAKLLDLGRVRGVIVANANHWRAAPEFSVRLSIPVLARKESVPVNGDVDFREINDGETVNTELCAIAIDGAVLGEIALFCQAEGGTLIMGDALINFEPLGFAPLPAKYCRNHPQMRQSLRKLFDCKANHILFAHGTPILSGATKRLRQLLDGDAS